MKRRIGEAASNCFPGPVCHGVVHVRLLLFQGFWGREGGGGGDHLRREPLNGEWNYNRGSVPQFFLLKAQLRSRQGKCQWS